MLVQGHNNALGNCFTRLHTKRLHSTHGHNGSLENACTEGPFHFLKSFSLRAAATGLRVLPGSARKYLTSHTCPSFCFKLSRCLVRHYTPPRLPPIPTCLPGRSLLSPQPVAAARCPHLPALHQNVPICMPSISSYPGQLLRDAGRICLACTKAFLNYTSGSSGTRKGGP